MSGPVLSLEGLDVWFRGKAGPAQVLDGVDLSIDSGEVVGLVGESGSGKSTLALALLGLLPEGTQVEARAATFDGRVLPALIGPPVEALRGADIALVFQDPMAALNPMFPVGVQMIDAQRRRFPNAPAAELSSRAERMLARVGVPEAKARLARYPHEFSGGMRQRIVIAMALLAEPRLLIADEPTTALDATIEAQIVEILKGLRQEIDGAVLVISHSLGLIAELCDRVVVMYAGTVVETGPVDAVLRNARHPYTRALLACEIDPFEPFRPDEPLVTVPGAVPDPGRRPEGCVFAPRCPARHERCVARPPLIGDGGRAAACWLEVAA